MGGCEGDKEKKVVGPDKVLVEVWKMLEYVGVRWLKDLFNKMIVEEKMPNKCKKSIVIPIFKGKGDVQECNNYRGIKLMSYSMKIWEKIIDKRIRGETAVTKDQFGFIPGMSTMEPLFNVRQLVEKYREKKNLSMVLIDLKKAC